LEDKELSSILQSIDSSSSPGADGWGMSLLKRVLSDNPESLTLLRICLNYFLLLGWFPKCWFVDRIIGIPKPGRPSETRPITITNLFRKIIAKTLLSLHRPLLLSYLPIHQYGVGIPNGCETITTLLTDSIDASKLNKENILILQLDISSAFPTVNHNIFLQKLISLKAPPPLISFFYQSFIYRRLFFFETLLPSEIPCDIGLPQGCPLSPIAFSIYTSDIIHKINSIKRTNISSSFPPSSPSSPMFSLMADNGHPPLMVDNGDPSLMADNGHPSLMVDNGLPSLKAPIGSPPLTPSSSLSPSSDRKSVV
jgi:hypothetical protein